MGGKDEILDIKVDDIKTAAPAFHRESVALAHALTTLKQGLAAAGAPWGDDEQGQKFHTAYGPHVTQIEHSAQVLGLTSPRPPACPCASGSSTSRVSLRTTFGTARPERVPVGTQHAASRSLIGGFAGGASSGGPMVQMIRKIAIGVTLALSCMACTSGSRSGAAHESTAGQLAPLSQLKSIDAKEARLIAEGEFPPQSQPPKVIGEVRKGAYRLTAYVQEDSCGLRVADATNPTRSLIHVTSAWPEKDSEGSTKYPAGPYSFASAAGPSESKTWASLGCSKSAMVIDYSSQDRGSTSDQQGSVSFKENSKVPGTLVLIVGSPEAREKILPQD